MDENDVENIIVVIIIILIILLIKIYMVRNTNTNMSNNMENTNNNCHTCMNNNHSYKLQEQSNQIPNSMPNKMANQMANQMSNQMPNQMHNQMQQPIADIEMLPPVLQVPPIGPLREYDYRTLGDPLVPPWKRDDYDSLYLPSAYSIPTRGLPSAFRKMGILIDDNAANDDPYKFMILMGRLKYPNGTTYQYYVTENRNDSPLKFELEKHRNQINDGDIIEIKDLKKNYRAKIDRTLGFDYIPI